MVACPIFALHNILSVNSASDSLLRVTGLSGYEHDWTAENSEHWLRMNRRSYRFNWSRLEPNST